MTSDRPFVFTAVVALAMPVLLFLTPLGDVTPAPVFLLILGLTILFQSFAVIGCWAVAACLTLQRSEASATRDNWLMLGSALASGWLLFVVLLLGGIPS